MKRLFAILVLLVAALTQGCREADLSEDFQLNDQLRMEIKGYVTFSYDPLNCQIGFNRSNCEFRVHSDNMSDFFSIKLTSTRESTAPPPGLQATTSTIKKLPSRSSGSKTVKSGSGPPTPA